MTIKREFAQTSPTAGPLSRMGNPRFSERRLRILNFLEAPWVTGPAKSVIGFARSAKKSAPPLRVDVAVSTFCRGRSPASNEFIVACKDAGLEVHVIHERFVYDPQVISAMRRLIAAYNPDIVQTHHVKSHFLMRMTGMHQHYRWIAFQHGYTWTSLKARCYNYLDRCSLPLATRVVTVCRPFASALERIGVESQRIMIQHNAVDEFTPAPDEQVAQLRHSLGIEPGTRVLLTVGRLSREKGHRDLIDAVALVRKEDRASRKFKLIVVGDGLERQRLTDQVTRLALENYVVFAGYQSDVSRFYTLADVMILPSHTEGSPIALLEAMAAGLPIIATAVGGMPEIVGPKQAALLVQKQDPHALARAINQLLSHDVLRRRFSQAARSEAKIYSLSGYCEALFSLYQNCLDEGAI